MGMMSEVAFNQLGKAVANKQERNKLLKGRTSEQQKAIKYFIGSGGCLSSSISDEEYESMVMAKVKGTDFKQKALGKMGLDEDQVKEIEPVHFESYNFGEKTWAKPGKDNKWRSSAYEISWIFFSSTQVYVYQYTFSMIDDAVKESTEEYFYKDITNFSAASETVEKETVDKVGCSGNTKVSRKNVNYDTFALVVPGEKFKCSMEQSDYTQRSIQGMKAKLREKKG